MSVRSKFERDLSPALRAVGFSIKIPDCSKAKKPFDYIVAIGTSPLAFRAVEAKRADGWVLGALKWESHQRSALAKLASIDPNSAWVAIGFLDLPRMERGPDRRLLTRTYSAEAFLIRWIDLVRIEIDQASHYSDLDREYPNFRLSWRTIGNKNYPSWAIEETHDFLQKT